MYDDVHGKTGHTNNPLNICDIQSNDEMSAGCIDSNIERYNGNL